MKKKIVLSFVLMVALVATVTGCSLKSKNNDSGKEYVAGVLLTDEVKEKNGYEVLYTYNLFDDESINIYHKWYTTLKIIDANQKIKSATLDGFKLKYETLVDMYKDISKVKNDVKINRIDVSEFNTKVLKNNEYAALSYLQKGSHGNGGYVDITAYNKTGQDALLKDLYPQEFRINYSVLNDHDLYDISFGTENSQQKLVDMFGKPYAVKAEAPLSKNATTLNVTYFYRIGDNYLLKVNYRAYLENGEIKFANGSHGGCNLVPYGSDKTVDEILGIKTEEK